MTDLLKEDATAAERTSLIVDLPRECSRSSSRSPRDRDKLKAIEDDNSSGKPSSPAAQSKYNLKMISLVVMVLQNVVTVLSIRYSRTAHADDPASTYISSTVVVLAEILKLVTCVFIVWYSEGANYFKAEVVAKWRDGLTLAVPAGIYALQNNLLYFALDNLDAAVYQVLYQLKLLTTALLSVLILHKRLTPLKWFSLCMLVGGVACVQLYGTAAQQKTDASDRENDERSATMGLVAVLTACFTSAFAGVYFEKILKGTKASIWVRNVQLALFGAVFSGAMTLYKDHDDIMDRGFFVGYSPLVWWVVTQQALGGLIVAMVVKYADNILKGFALSMAIVLTSLIAMRYQNFAPTLGFVFGSALVLSATFLYNRSAPPEPKTAKVEVSQV